MQKFLTIIVLLIAILKRCDACAPSAACLSQTVVYLSADSLFRLIDERSRTLRLAALGVDEAKEGESVARAAILPDVGVGLSVGWLGNGYLSDRDFSSGMKVHNPHSANNFAIDAVQTVYSGGAVTEGIRMARLNSFMARLDVERSRRDVRFVMLGWLTDLQCLYNRRRILDENITLARRVLDDMRVRNDEGVVLANDIIRYELRLEDMLLSRVRTDNDVRVVTHKIANALGFDVETTVFVPRLRSVDTDDSVDDEERWHASAMASAVELKKAALDVDICMSERRMVAAGRMPRLSVFACGRFDSPIVIEVPVINKNFMYWSAGVTVSYDISSLYTSRRRLRRADKAVERSRAAQALSAEKLADNVKEAYESRHTALMEVKTQEKSLELARNNYDIVAERYAAGMALVTDMVDAANVRLAAELGLENARAGLLFSYYRLQYVTNTIGD